MLVLALAGCGTDQAATTAPPESAAPTSASAAETIASPIPEESAAAPSSEESTNPLCALATMGEIQTVIGGTSTQIDVIDVPDLDRLTCVYLDTQNIYSSMSIDFVTTERLVKTASPWPTAAAYFAEWTRGSTPISGVGEGAAWVDLTNSLLILQGDTVVQISSSSDMADPAVRTQLEGLGRSVVERLP